MKKICLLLVAGFCMHGIVSAQLKCKVDECFELTGIACRLAGMPEYVNDDIPNYTKAIDHYFAKHSDHRLFPFLRDIRENFGISHNAFANAAGFLEIRNGNVSIKEGYDIGLLNRLDDRWTDTTFKTFAAYLNDFYKQTNFRVFYSGHTALYEVATQRLNEHLGNLNLTWFESFFGEKRPKPVIVVSLCNGRHNYAFSLPGADNAIGTVIGSGVDVSGSPTYRPEIVYTVVHELLHGYTNLLIQHYWPQVAIAAGKIYSIVSEQMRAHAYVSAQSMMIEWLDRLFAIMYFREHPIRTPDVDHLVRQNQAAGFIWMERSCAFMRFFYENRQRYKTVGDYMPQLMSFVTYTADNFDRVLFEYLNRNPYIAETFPVCGSTIDPAIETLFIRFSMPMSASHGLGVVDDGSVAYLPVDGTPSWADERTLIIPIDRSKLEHGKKYGIKLPALPFQSLKHDPMKADFEYLITIAK